MNTPHHDARSLAAHVIAPEASRTVAGKDMSLLSASASTKGSTAHVSLSNLDAAEARTVVLDLRGREVTGVSAQVLTAAELNSHNTPEHPEAVAPRKLDGIRTHSRGLELDLPAHSYVTVALELGGDD
jgi:alpha-N-arabinofuranosidase